MSRPGLAGPRTVLAWDRTALSAGGLGALLLKFGLDRGIVVEAVAGVCALLAAGLLAVGRPGRADPGDGSDARPLRPRALLAVAVLITAAGALTVLTVIHAA